MQELGHSAQILAWALALFGVFAGAYAGITRNSRWFESAAYSVVAVGLLSFIALFSLGYCFVTDDYSNQYVWQFSNHEMPWWYKISAIWGGMDGSMLLWCFMLSLGSSIVALGALRYRTAMMPWVISVMHSSMLFFLTVTTFFTNPFRYLAYPQIPLDGNGLNPLLQNTFMAIHPPMLYAGFTTFSIPYAFCLGALFAGNLTNEWIRLTRHWTLIAWGFLTTGIVLGGYWAYIELGWGGFWAWDPVENASFLPWLTGTAYLHSVMVQERKGMLKQWNIWLVVATYGLTVFGTFLTRSGVVQSVHAFASTDIGWVFLLYLGILVFAALGMTIYRRKELRPERVIVSFMSREAFFLLNNLLFLSICFAVLWGVLFPVLSEAVTGTKQTVGIPFFNAVTVPMFLLLLFLMGVGPLIAWQRASLKSLRQTFMWPLISAAAVAGVLVWAGVDSFYATLSYAICWFVTVTIFAEFHRGLSVQKAAAPNAALHAQLGRLMRRHRTRYGGYLVHLGVVVATIGITASMAHKVERDFSLAIGERFEIGRFILQLKSIEDRTTPNYSAVVSYVDVLSRTSGELLETLEPEMRRYVRNQESTTEVALRRSIREDLYLVMAGLDETGTHATLKVFINPLQVWLWFGVMIMIAGTIIVLIPRGRRSEVTSIEAAAELAASGGDKK